MRRTRGNTQMQENHENAFNLSISDLMAGMLSVFILAVCYFMLNLGQVKDQYMGNNAKRDQLLEEIQEEMSERGISVKIDKKQGVLRIPEGALFAQGEADVKEEGQQVIRNLGDVLYQLLDKKEYKNVVETVFIEGHTDNVDIHTDEFPSNWELSTARATSLVLYLIENHGFDPQKLSASGYGEFIRQLCLFLICHLNASHIKKKYFKII